MVRLATRETESMLKSGKQAVQVGVFVHWKEHLEEQMFPSFGASEGRKDLLL